MNKRQKYKRLKIQLRKLESNMVGLVTFPLDDKHLDVDDALNYFQHIANFFPNINWIALPDVMSFTADNKEVIQAYLEKCQEMLKGIKDE